MKNEKPLLPKEITSLPKGSVIKCVFSSARWWTEDKLYMSPINDDCGDPYSESSHADIDSSFVLVSKPADESKPAEWNGKGLPPIGFVGVFTPKERIDVFINGSLTGWKYGDSIEVVAHKVIKGMGTDPTAIAYNKDSRSNMVSTLANYAISKPKSPKEIAAEEYAKTAVNSSSNKKLIEQAFLAGTQFNK